jgi:hypothetical protein
VVKLAQDTCLKCGYTLCVECGACPNHKCACQKDEGVYKPKVEEAQASVL